MCIKFALPCVVFLQLISGIPWLSQYVEQHGFLSSLGIGALGTPPRLVWVIALLYLQVYNADNRLMCFVLGTMHAGK